VRELVSKPDNADKSVELEQTRCKPDEAVGALLDVIRSELHTGGARPDAATRIRTYRALGDLGPFAKSAIPFLVQQFNTNNDLVQFTAQTLPRLGQNASSAIPALMNVLNDPMPTPVFQDPVQRSDPRSWLLLSAADCLSRLEPISPAVVPAMIGWLEAPNLFCRRQAPRVLAQVGPLASPAIPSLVQACGDPDETVRRNATNAIAEIGSRPSTTKIAPE
jgi:HEAT repeat protein